MADRSLPTMLGITVVACSCRDEGHGGVAARGGAVMRAPRSTRLRPSRAARRAKASCRPTAGSTRRTTRPRSPRWPGRRPTTARSPRRAVASCASPSRCSARGQSVSPTSPAPTLAAALRWDATSHPLSVSSLDDELQSGSGSSDLGLLHGERPQRHPRRRPGAQPKGPSPRASTCGACAACLRRPPSSTATRARRPSAARRPGPTTLSLSNPADGFTSSADVTLQSATLGFFAPSGTTLAPAPTRRCSRSCSTASSPTTPTTRRARATTSGARRPCPPACSPSPQRRAARCPPPSATRRHHRQGQLRRRPLRRHLLVPRPGRADTGTLEVAAGPFTGAEFTLYTAETGTTTLDVSAPATLASASPPPSPRPPSTPRPGWASPIPRRARHRRARRARAAGGSAPLGLPIWVAIVVLVCWPSAPCSSSDGAEQTASWPLTPPMADSGDHSLATPAARSSRCSERRSPSTTPPRTPLTTARGRLSP